MVCFGKEQNVVRTESVLNLPEGKERGSHFNYCARKESKCVLCLGDRLAKLQAPANREQL